MLVALTEDQEFFRETTERFLVEHAPPDAVRALRDDPVGFDPAYWRRGAELGLDLAARRTRTHGGGTHQRRRPGRPEPGGLRVRAPRRARAAAAHQHRRVGA